MSHTNIVLAVGLERTLHFVHTFNEFAKDHPTAAFVMSLALCLIAILTIVGYCIQQLEERATRRKKRKIAESIVDKFFQNDSTRQPLATTAGLHTGTPSRQELIDALLRA